MNLVRLEDWRLYYKDGEQYFKTALNAAQKRAEIFTPEILYNLTAMAIEKYLMAFLMYHNDLADNHTMRDMIDSVERHGKMPEALVAKLLYLDSFQEICDMDSYNRTAPRREDLPLILAAGEEVKAFVNQRIEVTPN